MYKKITHNIVEEHFDHPAVLPREMRPSLPAGATLPPEVMTENTMLFRLDSRTLWSKYVWGLLNYGIALNNKLPGVNSVENRTVKHAGALGDFAAIYYGATIGEEFARLLKKFIKIGVDVVNIIKDGGTVDGGESLFADVVDELAKFLHSINPTQWPEAVVKEYLTALAKFWIAEINSRAAQDWTMNDFVIENISKLVVSGPGVNGGNFGSLADIFSKGIIAQFPDKFVS